jgi:hypothetical protein
MTILDKLIRLELDVESLCLSVIYLVAKKLTNENLS